jgi:hypothetical protein
MHEIATAYDAFHFLREHPAFRIRERIGISLEDATKLEKQGCIITRDLSGKCYKEYRHIHKLAMDSNLVINYAKVNSEGYSGKPDSSIPEVWLEFGPLEWGYDSHDGVIEEGGCEWDVDTHLKEYHDTELDCGAPTFDEALKTLAMLVLKHYGDFEDWSWKERRKLECGTPVCSDCQEANKFAKA